MSDVLDRFLRYVRVDSQSDPHNEEQTPSTATQHEMARLLGAELSGLGCADVCVTGHAYVTATVPASAGAEGLPALGLVAHVDTSFDAPASGVCPRVVRYEGGPLVMGEVGGVTVQVTPDELPELAGLAGKDVVVTDGRTLLGADDKAGVAEIMALASRLMADPSLPRPALRLAFVPDEEIGHGAALLDLDAYGAAWAYTVDGEALGEINYECFSASQATVTAHGRPVHPGTAKGRMLNALTVLREFDELVPAAERPEHTSGREGFYHMVEASGTTAQASASYIVRDFDAGAFAARERTLRDVAAFLNGRYGAGTVEVELREQYRNMAERLEGLEFLVERAKAANEAVGLAPSCVAVRGGTDGAQLTFRGLPCPNLATGGFLCHSVREFIPVQSLELTVDLLQDLVSRFA